MKRFENKVAFITGGSSGIGLSSARLIAQEGARVCIADWDEAAGANALASLRNEGYDVMFVKCDVSRAEDCQKAIAETVKYFGRLDIAFNNAGIGGASAPVAEYPVVDWDRIISINLSGVWYCMKYELEQMMKQKSGSIINMASILGHAGFANSSGYVAAKHGVIGMTKTAAVDYGTSGIRINAICPGFIMTPLLTHAGIEENNDFGKMIASLHPMKRLGKPEEIAKGFLYLASDDASFVHGTSLVIDGGYLAQ